MCTISNNIVLCTCEVKDIDQLKNYWVLFRYAKNRQEVLVGEPIGWEDDLQDKDPHNPVLLWTKLQAGTLFDQPIEFKEKDRLLVSFLFRGNSQNVDYGFEYKKGEWRVIDYEYFDWAHKHKEILQGKIKKNTK